MSGDDPRAKIRFFVDSKRADAHIVQAVVAVIRDRFSKKPPPPEDEESKGQSSL
ncbi:MAG: hypothetical protein Q8Q52_04215 [Acidimicrobiia bacterium]|nr:hypothetical protein [Acidimicrobiia bacterium]